MYNIVTHPNLPKNIIQHCLIGEKYTEEINELEKLGITCISLKENNLLDEEIKGHADILSFNLGNGKILINPGSTGESALEKIGFKPQEVKDITSPYPYDISLNAAYLNNKIICNSKYTNKIILDYAEENNIEIIHSKQGYSRCNLCIVNENAVITEDNGLACLLKNYQFDVLKISSGDVYLSEKHSGFLGGASGKISRNEIYFSGDLSKHSDYDAIIKFLNKYDVQPIFNKSRQLCDFGGFIQLTEKIL